MASSVDDPKTFGRTRLSFATTADVDEFAETLARFEKGEITADQWKVFRLVRGTYGQRQATDSQMLRVKIPQGILTAEQLNTIATVAQDYSRGFGHITTRQNIQLHFVKLHEVELAMRLLADAGLTTREACGNSVRNITTCPYAGVAHDEPFDVTPYAEATTRYLLRHPLTSSLPRKFKIAFEGCPEDHTLTGINDLGFVARVDAQGQRGFRVTVAGGTSTVPTDGPVLHPFLPATEVLEVSEAVVRIFHRHGDRQHRQRNRLKFLMKELGWESFKAKYFEALAEFRAEGGAKLPVDPRLAAPEGAIDFPRPAAPEVGQIAARAVIFQTHGPGIEPEVKPDQAVTRDGFARWSRHNVRPQKQPGYAMATVRLVLGDLTSEQLRLVSELARVYGDGQVRVTPSQNLVFRWVKTDQLFELYRRLAAAGMGHPDAETVADVLSCPGAESCRLAVTQSRGLGRLLGEHLQAHPEWVELAPDLKLKISGCPNGCGQHHIAGIGFQGSVRKVGAKVVPQYFVLVGGGDRQGQMKFGRLAAKIPARRLTDALDLLLGHYRSNRAPGQTATDYFQGVEVAAVKKVLAPLEAMTPENAKPEDYIDLGEDTEFKPETMEGECAA